MKISALGAMGTMIPAGLASAATPAAAKKKAVKSDKINLGFIGLGQQGINLLNGFLKIDEVRVVAGADVYDVKRDRFVKKVTDYYTGKGEKNVKVDVYVDYPDLLAREDIDAVVIATPDHWHALMAIDACKAGKDVYLEKPMTLTVFEGQMLCKAVRKYSRILQVGSMQRSSSEFIHACNLVREGDLGEIKRVNVFVGRNDVNRETGAPRPCTLPRMEVPAGLDWNKWLGPLPESVYYHSDLNPVITAEDPREKLWGAWRWYTISGGGLMTDWGAHMFDIAQWGLGKDGSGPVEVIPPGYEYYKALTYRYESGLLMTEEPFDGMTPGVKFYGEEGWISVSRGKFQASDDKFAMKAKKNDDGTPYETNVGHYQAFINAIKSRIDPNVPVEYGHSSATVCNIGNIAMELGRPLKWNPIVQKFMKDDEANKKLHYDYREGYKLEI